MHKSQEMPNLRNVINLSGKSQKGMNLNVSRRFIPFCLFLDESYVNGIR